MKHVKQTIRLLSYDAHLSLDVENITLQKKTHTNANMFFFGKSKKKKNMKKKGFMFALIQFTVDQSMKFLLARRFRQICFIV